MTNTMRVRWLGVAAAIARVTLVAMVASGTASAQQRTTVFDVGHGTLLSGFVGTQSASSAVNAAAGLGLGWEISRHVSIEGRGTWLRVNDAATDFAATLSGHFPVFRAGSFVPFVSAGVGMYRATFDAASKTVPEFYMTRMGGMMPARRQTFQDFLLTVGGGTNVFVSSHVALRPEVNVMMAATRTAVRPFGMLGLQVVYHFEAHPVE